MADTPRFQFHIQDLLVIIVLPALLTALIVLVVPGASSALSGVLFGVLFLFSALGGSFGIRSSQRNNFTGLRRAVSLLIHCGVLCGLLLGVIVMAIPMCSIPRSHVNEMSAVSACKEFAEAEEIYHRTDYKKTGTKQYARSLRELYETAPNKGDLALVDKGFVSAEGNPGSVGSPYRGYCFKVLFEQGSHASGGAKAYIVDGKMTGGYALVAYPFKYGESGYNTFIVNNSGIFQKDLGERTDEIVGKMTVFDPDTTWVQAE